MGVVREEFSKDVQRRSRQNLRGSSMCRISGVFLESRKLIAALQMKRNNLYNNIIYTFYQC